MSSTLISNRKTWNQKFIQKTKGEIKDLLDRGTQPSKPETRLIYAVDLIRDLEEDSSAVGQLRRYILLVSALICHEQHGGLKPRHVQNFIRLGYAILQTQGIRPGSRLGFLYGDLHLAMSQIYRKEGEQWKSAWEQQVSFFLSKRNPTGGLGFQTLASGIRALRQGHSALAIMELSKAENALGNSRSLALRVALEKLKALRLQGRFDEAKAYLSKVKANFIEPAQENQEISWEEICLKVQESQDIHPLVVAVQGGRSHHFDGYLHEAFLWTRAVSSTDWIKRFPTIRSLARDPHMKVKTQGFFFESLTVIEQCYDYQIPYTLRIRRLGEVLSQTNRFFAIDTELLYWAAAVRWLFRGKTSGFLDIVLSEYQGLSLKLTSGISHDALGVLDDLKTKDKLVLIGKVKDAA